MIELKGSIFGTSQRGCSGNPSPKSRALGRFRNWRALWGLTAAFWGLLWQGEACSAVKQASTPAVPGAPLPPGMSAVPTAPQASVPELHEIRDAIHIPSVWDWLRPTLIAVGLLLLLGLLWWRFRNRKSAAQQIRETAAERARKRLNGVLKLMEDPERFCTSLSEIVRVYLEERFRIRAPEQTTEEFLADTQKNAILDEKHRALLAGFLEQCDLVKFAGLQPAREDLVNLHRSAGDFVEETAFELPPLAEALESGGTKR